MKRIYLVNKDRNHASVIFVPSIVTGKGRDMLLQAFRNDPDLAYAETKVRRYTASDIYAGRSGQAI